MELYLLTEASTDVDFGSTPFLHIDGRTWQRIGPLSRDESTTRPEFACISYVWGSERVPNPLDIEKPMSDQTLLSLSAAIKVSTVSAFWIDAFCVPVIQPSRNATLESMGYIYSIAKEVIVALSPDRSGALEEMGRSEKLREQTLLALEHDEWVRSVWTYQEVVNSQSLYFTTTNPLSSAVVDGSTFLNRIGYALHFYKQEHGFNAFDLRRRLRCLDAFEDLIGDWMISAYTDRSALQVMSNLDRRSCTVPQNYYYSMIGSITQLPSYRAAGLQVTDLVEKTMQICEQKNDYSFIFSTAARNELSATPWRPQPEPLHSILPYFSHGARQGGRHDAHGFWLEKMVCLRPVNKVEDANDEKNVQAWLEKLPVPWSSCNPETALANDILDFLEQIGFTGSREYLETSFGVFYPQKFLSADHDHDIYILLATQTAWTFGHPGIVKARIAGRWMYSPGVFIGAVDKSTATDYLLHPHEG